MRRRFFNNNIEYFDINDYLTIEALEDNLQIYFPHEDLMYSIDGFGWQKLAAGAYSTPINAGQTISFKGNVNSTMLNFKSFTITKRCNLLGNCMSLTLNNAPHFSGLFNGCTTIVCISKDFLPATTLANNCYYGMFEGCTSLTTVPELPATTLESSCYEYMFNGCTSLTTAPTVLPAMTLTDSCYHGMFSSCSSLKTAPELPATTLANNCYSSMFYGCSSLATAPNLPATTLASYCYYGMFYGCTKLNYIKMLATDISAKGCLSYWVNGVSGTGTFVKNPAMTSLPTGQSGIPRGWTVVNDGEESGGGKINITLELHQHYPDLVQYLENKYGFGFGSIKNPIAIEENIFTGNSFATTNIGVGQVKFLSIGSTPSTVGIKLYLEDYKETYYCVVLDNSSNAYGKANYYLWD